MTVFRKFFFDDGSSRKRWQIALNGKNLVTRSGTLRGELRETNKSLQTTAAAKQALEKAVTTKIQQGFVEVRPERLEIKRSRSRNGATEREVKALESLLGFPIPTEYRNFLKSSNGGSPNPDCVKVPGVKGIDNVGVGILFHLLPTKPGPDETSHELKAIGLPKGHLPIAQSSDVFSISLSPKTYGCIYWWNHDDGEDREHFVPSDAYLLSSSFDEFLTRIASFHDETNGKPESADEPTIGQSKRTSAVKSKPLASATSFKRLISLVSHEPTPSKLKEIKELLKDLDLSTFPEGKWPFKNIRSPEMLECLLNAGLNPEMTDTDNHSLLWLCAGSAPCIELLLAKGVDLERRSGGEKETALMRAMFVQDVPSVKRLIEAGANPTVVYFWSNEKQQRTKRHCR